MRLYSYVVARDYGFAPNPFFGICTLATCKPQIRKRAQAGDWVIGTGSKRYDLGGHLVYAMKVTEALTYDEYWSDKRFLQKRPNLAGSLKQAFGDNIYHRHPRTGRWLQENSHHSLKDGQPNRANIDHDTQVQRVLVGAQYVYWGSTGPRIPSRFRSWKGLDICCQQPGHKCIFPQGLSDAFVRWIIPHSNNGYAGQPMEFDQ